METFDYILRLAFLERDIMKRKSIVALFVLLFTMICTLFTPIKSVHAEEKNGNESITVSLSEVEIFLETVRIQFCIKSDRDGLAFGTSNDGYVITIKTELGDFTSKHRQYKVKKGESHLTLFIVQTKGKVESISISPIIDTNNNQILLDSLGVDMSNHHVTNRVPIVVIDAVLLTIYASIMIVIFNISKNPLKYDGIMLLITGSTIFVFSFFDFIVRPLTLAKYHISFEPLSIIAFIVAIGIIVSGVVCVKLDKKRKQKLIENNE